MVEWLRWWMARRSLAGAGNGDGGRSTLRLLLWASTMAMVEQRNGNGECGSVWAGAGVMQCAGAWLCRVGQDAGDARPLRTSTRRAGSVPVGHRRQSIQSVQSHEEPPDSTFSK